MVAVVVYAVLCVASVLVALYGIYFDLWFVAFFGFAGALVFYRLVRFAGRKLDND